MKKYLLKNTIEFVIENGWGQFVPHGEIALKIVKRYWASEAATLSKLPPEKRPPVGRYRITEQNKEKLERYFNRVKKDLAAHLEYLNMLPTPKEVKLEDKKEIDKRYRERKRAQKTGAPPPMQPKPTPPPEELQLQKETLNHIKQIKKKRDAEILREARRTLRDEGCLV